jgi:CRISPR-associated endonuclease Cas1
MGWRKHGDHARHPINSMLNYGYAMLVSQLRADVLTAGFDPSIAFFHGNSRHQMPLVYDLMEPLRPVVDEKILKFALSNTFSPGDFTISTIGACRLNPQLAKKIAVIAAKFETRDLIHSLVRATQGPGRIGRIGSKSEVNRAR